MKKLFALLAITLLVTFSNAQAQSRCEASKQVELTTSKEEIKSLLIEFGSGDLDLIGKSGADRADFMVTFCASDQRILDGMSAELQNLGDRLVLDLHHDGRSGGGGVFRWIFGDSDYRYFNVTGSIPAEWLVELELGSGDATIENIAAVEFQVGSGDLELREITENVKGRVGSGDLSVRGALGNAFIRSIGSGDALLADVQGNIEVGSIGSGDLVIRNAGQNVTIDSIGSGDATAMGVKGNFVVVSKGSGDAHASRVDGEILIPER